MASALCMMCCEAKIEARFFTVSSLVMRLRRASADGRLDRELSRIGRADLPVVDELGFLPLDAEGARLLFQVVSQAREAQPAVLHRQPGVLEVGRGVRRRPDGRGGHRPGGPPRQAPALQGRVVQGEARPHAGRCSENLRKLDARTAQKPMHILLRDC